LPWLHSSASAVLFVAVEERKREKGREKIKQTYFSSAVWAAMRVRRDLSASGQPDRLEDKFRVEELRN